MRLLLIAFVTFSLGAEGDVVNVGLPDTIWFPKDALSSLPTDSLSFLLFPVDRPEIFDAVVMAADGKILEIQVKTQKPRPRPLHWRMPS